MDTHSLHTPTSLFVAKGAILNKDYITLFKKKKKRRKISGTTALENATK